MTHAPSRVRTAAAGAAVALLASVVAGSIASPAAALPDKTVTGSNPAAIAIPEQGPGVPARSPITVKPGFGKVTDVDVTLNGLNHTCPADLLVTLVGPGGQAVNLMDEAGDCDTPDVPAVLTFDDEAAGLLPGAAVVSGTYKPTDTVTPDPAPALSVFDGLAASGTWELVVVDKYGGDLGYITGWSIEIDYNDTTVPTGSVTVNAGGASTGSTAVSLGLSASDPGADSTGVASMRFSNDGTNWSAFQAYAPTASWTLAAGDGTKTVWAQYADGLGNLSAPATDTIVLDTTAPKAKKLTPKKNATDVSVKTKVSFVASESLDASTVGVKTVKLTAGGKTVKAKVSYSAGKKKVILKPAKPLDGHTKYKVTVAKLTDVSGNAIAKTTWKFTTGS